MRRPTLATPSSEDSAVAINHAEAFAVAYARALLQYGLPAHRIEEAIFRLAQSQGFEADVFCTPTAMIFTIQNQHHELTRVVRVVPGAPDFEKLAELYALAEQVEKRSWTVQEASLRMEQILSRPSRYHGFLTILSYVLAAAGATLLLGGSWADVVASLFLGAMVGCVVSFSTPWPSLHRLAPMLCAALVSIMSRLLASQSLELTDAIFGREMRLHPSVLLLASITVLLPGFTITTSVIEMATLNLVSGTARLMGGIMTFLQMMFGLALGQVVLNFLPRVREFKSTPIAYGFVLAVLVNVIALTLLLRIRPKDMPWVLGSIAVAALGNDLGARMFGAELSAFGAALLVGWYSHGFSQITRKPSQIALVPGMLTLVPGSIGFLSISALLDNEVTPALETGFRMLFVAVALALGLLMSSMIAPRQPSQSGSS